MKVEFIEAKYKGKISLNKKLISALPEKIGLITTVQFVDQIDNIKKILEKNKIKCFIEKGNQKYKAQILGCDISAADKIKSKVDAFLYIGTGEFHPIAVAEKTGKKVISYNPVTKHFYDIKLEVTEKIKKKRKGAYLKFLSSENIGVLVSTKPGQQAFKKAFELKKRFKDKHFYIFAFDTLDPVQMENFPFIEAWVNTACPRISDNKNIINIDEI